MNTFSLTESAFRILKTPNPYRKCYLTNSIQLIDFKKHMVG